MEIVKIAAIGISGVLIGLLLKGSRPEYTMFVTLGIGILILTLVIGKLEILFEMLFRIQSFLPGENSYISTLVKMLGITYIGQFTSAICKETGFPSIGMQIEIFCRLSLLMLSMPILLALLDTIQTFF